MDLIQIVTLAVVQGVTEFLPISSSAHLILFPHILGWPDQGLSFDVAVHVGSLAAVVIYFYKDLRLMFRDWFGSLIGCEQTFESRLAWAVVIGTIPVALVGLVFKDLIEVYLRSPLVIAGATIVFGLLLWWADAKGKKERDEHSMSWGDVLFIGFAQALALIPGTSRSGITMTAALMLGLNRSGAARFSFLLSIPAIVLPGGLITLELITSEGIKTEWNVLILGALLSGISAYACIHYFLKLLEKIGMLPFVIYRLLLGLFLVGLFAF